VAKIKIRRKNMESNREVSLSVREQLIEESVAMAKYALASGLGVPGDIVETLEAFSQQKIAATGPEGEPARPRTILLLDREGRKKSYFSHRGHRGHGV
jgi:hypothetical protein